MVKIEQLFSMKGYLFTFLSIVLLINGCKSPSNDLFPVDNSSSNMEEQIIHHESFSLQYSEQHEQARWVQYTLTKDEVFAKQERSDDFREDSLVATGSSVLSDYKYSGYDRGHLKPAADSKASVEEMSESFLLSNISPQKHRFNAGIWNSLENAVRGFAIAHQTIIVVTGPVLNHPLGSIGENRVSIPEAFYKAILNSDSSESIAFLPSHEESDSKLNALVITVDSLEKVTGLNIFRGVNDDVESAIDTAYWGL